VFACFATLGSIPYFLIMAFKLKTFCLFCLFLDGIGITSLITVFTLRPAKLSVSRADSFQWKSFGGVLLISMLLSTFVSKSMEGTSISQMEINDLVDSILHSNPIAIPTSPEHPSIGPAGAPITVIEYSDFQCPYCKIGAYAMHAAMNSHPGQVLIEFRNFPLDAACNPEIQHSAHPVACEAARVAICAHQCGKFEAMHDGFFDKQSKFMPGFPLTLAKNLGIAGSNASEISGFESCLVSPETSQIVQKDISEGILLGVKSRRHSLLTGTEPKGLTP
jgi:protein-disulfide isomerase